MNTIKPYNPNTYEPLSYYQKRITKLWENYKRALDNGNRMAEIGMLLDSNAWYNTAKGYWEKFRVMEREQKALQSLNMALEKKRIETGLYRW